MFYAVTQRMGVLNGTSDALSDEQLTVVADLKIQIKYLIVSAPEILAFSNLIYS